jgi:hypothetical protein
MLLKLKMKKKEKNILESVVEEGDMNNLISFSFEYQTAAVGIRPCT